MAPPIAKMAPHGVLRPTCQKHYGRHKRELLFHFFWAEGEFIDCVACARLSIAVRQELERVLCASVCVCWGYSGPGSSYGKEHST